MQLFLVAIVGVAVGVIGTIVYLRPLVVQLRSSSRTLEKNLESLRGENQALLVAKATAEARLAEHATLADGKLGSALREMTEKLMQSSTSQLAALTQQIVKAERAEDLRHLEPVKTELSSLAKAVDLLAKSNAEGTGSLREAFANVQKVATDLQLAVQSAREETSKLSGALSNSAVRGQWGEIALQRIIELAGMTEHCDFETQVTQATDDGKQRPDVLIRLPGKMHVPIDAKAPYAAYASAFKESDPKAQERLLGESAVALRQHVNTLAARRYHAQEGSAGFTIMFVGMEAMLSAALTIDPELLIYAADRRVHIASPITLLMYLHAFAQGWMLQKQSDNAEQIVAEARTMHERFSRFSELLVRHGEALATLVGKWNEVVGSFDGRLIPSAKRISQLTGFAPIVLSPSPVDVTPRQPKAVPVPQGSLFGSTIED